MDAYYAAIGTQSVVSRLDGAALIQKDMRILRGVCAVQDEFAESTTGIHAIGLTEDCILPDGYVWSPIRQQFAALGDDSFFLSRAKALLAWRANTQYCGRCGTKLQDDSQFMARICPDCGNLIFPRIEPCIIVIVKHQDKILLAKHVQRNQDIFACIAGFMEAGESAEHAVAREIYEETHLHVKNIRYFGSQSWPFPAQLMLGFTAEYESGTLALQADEISEVRWFTRADLLAKDAPAFPRVGSIANRLITTWLDNN